MTHCGLCHSDIHMIDNDWRMAHYPLVPGHELVGEVVELGAGIAHLKVGQRVGVGWQRSACLQCPECLRGAENLCSENKGTITDGYGGFADHIQVDARFCFPLPDGIASVAAGPLLCGGVTVYSGLRHAGMTSGQEIGVVGVGGLGHLAIQFASRLGNRVTALTSSANKIEIAVKLGAHEAIVYHDAPTRKPARPFDILISTAALNLDWPAFIDLLGPDGTLVFVGIPPKPFMFNPGLLLQKRRRIMASPIGGRAVVMETLKVADRFGIEPMVERFPLRDVNKAIDRVRGNLVRFRAVVEAG